MIAALAVASMAGVPLAAGFIAKELAYGALSDADFTLHLAVLACAVVGSMLTVAYSMRFYWGVFVAPQRRVHDGGESPPPPSSAFLVPAAVLAVVGIVLGIAPGLLDSLATASLQGYGVDAPEVHLSLWHGLVTG